MKFNISYLSGLCLLLTPLWATAEVLDYQGSSTIGKFMTDASAVYQGATFKIDTRSESAGGEQCVSYDRCQLGGVARDVRQRFLNKDVVATLIGKDAIAAIVHKDNPVKELTKTQLKGIFTGQITNWSALGGADLPIHPLVVKATSATRNVFAEAILGDEPYLGVEVVTPDAKMVTEVSRDPSAIGQISFAFLEGVDSVNRLTIEGQEASVENANYPITRPLYLTTKGQPAGAVKDFITWTLSPAGQAIVKRRFVGVTQ